MAIIVFGYRNENNRFFAMDLTTINTLHAFFRAVIALIYEMLILVTCTKSEIKKAPLCREATVIG